MILGSLSRSLKITGQLPGVGWEHLTQFGGHNVARCPPPTVSPGVEDYKRSLSAPFPLTWCPAWNTPIPCPTSLLHPTSLA